jgi:hypothetical protein
MNTFKDMVPYHRKTPKNPGDQGQDDKVLDANQLRSIVGTVTAIIGLQNEIKRSLRDCILSPLMG